MGLLSLLSKLTTGCLKALVKELTNDCYFGEVAVSRVSKDGRLVVPALGWLERAAAWPHPCFYFC